MNRLGLLDDADILLDDAALTLAELDHPDVDAGPYRTLLVAIANRVVGIAAETASERAEALTRVLADEFGFSGDEDTYDDPANADLIRVLDRRRGLPVALSILYVAAARRCGWRADVLDIPGHVLVIIGVEAAPVIIDPFHRGTLVSRERLIGLLKRGGAKASGPTCHVAAMPNRAVLVRLIMNQAGRAEEAGWGRRALELYRRMTVVAPGHGQAWWERARLELIDEDAAGARRSLSALLEVTREPILRERVSRMLVGLARQ